MSSKPTAFERIAALLPQEERVRFLSLSTRLKELPEDDEFLLALELICYSTLIWHEVPTRIQELLEKSNPVVETTHSIAGELKEALIQEVPSCEDLRDLSIRLGQHEKNLQSQLRRAQRQGEGGRVSGMLWLAVGLFGGFLLRGVLSWL